MQRNLLILEVKSKIEKNVTINLECVLIIKIIKQLMNILKQKTHLIMD